MLPRDISQQIINELVYSGCLTDVSFEGFRDCALQVAHSNNTGNHFLILIIFFCQCCPVLLLLSVRLTLKVSVICLEGSLLGRIPWCKWLLDGCHLLARVIVTLSGSLGFWCYWQWINFSKGLHKSPSIKF